MTDVDEDAAEGGYYDAIHEWCQPDAIAYRSPPSGRVHRGVAKRLRPLAAATLNHCGHAALSSRFSLADSVCSHCQFGHENRSLAVPHTRLVSAIAARYRALYPDVCFDFSPDAGHALSVRLWSEASSRRRPHAAACAA
jgi:hypothetical protein